MTEPVNLVTQFDEIVANNPDYKVIYIKNVKRDVIASTLVDAKYYDEIIENYSVSLSGNGYAKFYHKQLTKTITLHHYIHYILEENLRCKERPNIDHKNRNKLDNTIDNLENVSYSDNMQNKSKTKDGTSKHFGVCECKKSSKWVCRVTHNKTTYSFYYDIQEHAAYHYNLLVIELGLRKELNNVDKPADFIRKEKKIKVLPVGVNVKGSKFSANYKNKCLGIFDTVKKAELCCVAYKKTLRLITIAELKTKDILRNEHSHAIIPLFDRHKKNVGNVIVDDDKYYYLILIRWSFQTGGYARGWVNGKKVMMHKFILNYKGDDVVDHKNGNRIDNRVQNLHVVTRKENSQNRKSLDGSSSKYVGVCWNKRCKKWQASIGIDGKTKHLGYFENKKDAARARDKATRKLHTNGKLNFSDE